MGIFLPCLFSIISTRVPLLCVQKHAVHKTANVHFIRTETYYFLAVNRAMHFLFRLWYTINKSGQKRSHPFQIGYRNYLPKCTNPSPKEPSFDDLGTMYSSLNENLIERPLEGKIQQMYSVEESSFYTSMLRYEMFIAWWLCLPILLWQRKRSFDKQE